MVTGTEFGARVSTISSKRQILPLSRGKAHETTALVLTEFSFEFVVNEWNMMTLSLSREAARSNPGHEPTASATTSSPIVLYTL